MDDKESSQKVDDRYEIWICLGGTAVVVAMIPLIGILYVRGSGLTAGLLVLVWAFFLLPVTWRYSGDGTSRAAKFARQVLTGVLLLIPATVFALFLWSIVSGVATELWP